MRREIKRDINRIEGSSVSGSRVGWGWGEWERGRSVDIRGMKWERNHPELMNVHEEIYYFLY